MRDVFEFATRKGSDPVINSDMTVELQSLSTQYYMLVMMLSDQALEIVRNSSKRSWCRSVAQVALEVRTWRWYQVRSNVAIAVEETIR